MNKQQRLKISIEQCTQLKQLFYKYINTVYSKYFTTFDDAYVYYNKLTIGEKRQFRKWHEIDENINHKNNCKKSFSYKYVTEVLAAKRQSKWTKLDLERAKQLANTQFQLIQDKILTDLSNKEILIIRSKLIDTVYNQVKNNECTAKSMKDMLRNQFNKLIMKALQHNQQINNSVSTLFDIE
ncbi:Hypothetical_protein [Hexamita inflata]|uniref:Hypothetical_protein n=1 Tax=Hexamita inflata TaxID=28002 RepID=A0AA86P6L2_9EUKA|nr:Hypothetical protein HINF_LOCUS20524 [Hexamita inflata]CAI9934551.1 Hypothetical protein HINF_LOCUS22196 [Hexamita inflata]